MILSYVAFVLAAKPKIETLIFVTSECPISKRYTPAIKRIMKEFKDVSTFRMIYEDEGIAYAKLKEHHLEYNIKCQMALDTGHEIAKKYEVTAVPTVVTKTSKGQVLYAGRIDDSYGSDFKWHPVKSEDLRNALNAIKSGSEVPVKKTPVIGCTISK